MKQKKWRIPILVLVLLVQLLAPPGIDYIPQTIKPQY